MNMNEQTLSIICFILNDRDRGLVGMDVLLKYFITSGRDRPGRTL